MENLTGWSSPVVGRGGNGDDIGHGNLLVVVESVLYGLGDLFG
ncbi:hypothetical protein ACFV2X_24815 [Streptomyces sp. NPDC059679]